jgi:hypothetical protein
MVVSALSDERAMSRQQSSTRQESAAATRAHSAPTARLGRQATLPMEGFICRTRAYVLSDGLSL